MERNESIAVASIMYAMDHDDRLPPLLSQVENECTSRKYLAQLILPYHGDWMNYRCPDDPNIEDALALDACEQVPTKVFTRQQRESTASLLAHRGYNQFFLAPIADHQISWPITRSDIANPANTIMFLDSIGRKDASGNPTGGGSFGIDPPCFRNADGSLSAPFPPGYTTWYWFGGWRYLEQTLVNQYGRAWPWHERGTFVGVMADGTARGFRFEALTDGCQLLENGAGLIYDMEAYRWDIHE